MKPQRLIDANALMRDIARYHLSDGKFQHWVEVQPTVDAEPVRHGKWMFTPSDAFEAMFTKPKCSECGFESADGGNYCPNCGADMRGEKDG